jgi:ABC-type dipeptide/oligopeptide/nickel transport system permease subunit
VDLNLTAAHEVLGVVDELFMNPATFMLMIPLVLLMVALTDIRKGFPRMMEVY